MREQFQNLTDEALPRHLYNGLYCLMRHAYHDRGQEAPRGTDVSSGTVAAAERLLGEPDKTLQRMENGERSPSGNFYDVALVRCC